MAAQAILAASPFFSDSAQLLSVHTFAHFHEQECARLNHVLVQIYPVFPLICVADVAGCDN